MSAWLDRLVALDPRWKLALGAVATVLLLARCTGGDGGEPSAVPAGIRAGALLSALQLQGEEPVFVEAGIEILAVDEPWVCVRFGDNAQSDRWFNFEYVTGYMLHPGR